nr:MAG TPA: hypothetical protein [Caudoviricetes sp.]
MTLQRYVIVVTYQTIAQYLNTSYNWQHVTPITLTQITTILP